MSLRYLRVIFIKVNYVVGLLILT